MERSEAFECGIQSAREFYYKTNIAFHFLSIKFSIHVMYHFIKSTATSEFLFHYLIPVGSDLLCDDNDFILKNLLSLSKTLWQELKESRCQILWEAISKAIPDIKDRVEVKMIGTPLTHKRFLYREEGTYGGYGWIGNGNLSPSPATPIDGLYLVGDSQFPGMLMYPLSIAYFSFCKPETRKWCAHTLCTYTYKIESLADYFIPFFIIIIIIINFAHWKDRVFPLLLQEVPSWQILSRRSCHITKFLKKFSNKFDSFLYFTSTTR